MYFPPDFDLDRAVELARLIVQAYDQLESFQNGSHWSPKNGYTLVADLVQESTPLAAGKTHTQFATELKLLQGTRRLRGKDLPIGFIARREGAVFVIFRGTVTTAEWVHNLNVRLASYPLADFGTVHEGFLETYANIRKPMLQVLAGMDARCRLFVSGHSLGAALATLALPDVAANTRLRSPTIYTFGSPRIGDNQFCTYFDGMFARRSFRIVNTSDIIVSLPLPVPILGVIGGYFSHVETPIDFTVQEGAMEKNHVIGTYLSALLSAQQGKGAMLARLLKWRLTSR